MAILKVVKKFPSGDEFILGYVCQRPSGGYWFNPKVPHRKSSRKDWPTPWGAIPAWARKEADEYIPMGEL